MSFLEGIAGVLLYREYIVGERRSRVSWVKLTNPCSPEAAGYASAMVWLPRYNEQHASLDVPRSLFNVPASWSVKFDKLAISIFLRNTLCCAKATVHLRLKYRSILLPAYHNSILEERIRHGIFFLLEQIFRFFFCSKSKLYTFIWRNRGILLGILLNARSVNIFNF